MNAPTDRLAAHLELTERCQGYLDGYAMAGWLPPKWCFCPPGTSPEYVAGFDEGRADRHAQLPVPQADGHGGAA